MAGVIFAEHLIPFSRSVENILFGSFSGFMVNVLNLSCRRIAILITSE